MLLRNYYNLQAALALGIQSTDTDTFGDGHINAKNYSGAIKDIQPVYATSVKADSYGFGWAANTILSAESSVQSSATVCFGTGTTAVTYEDYKLEAIITTGLAKASFTHGTPSYNSETKKWDGTLSCVTTNTSGSTITINEIGIYMPVTYSGGNSGHGTLVYREVLTTPITIAAGASVTYTQNLEYTMPTFS